MRTATHTPNIGNGSSACNTIVVVGRLCQTPTCKMRTIATHGRTFGLSIPRQLAFGRTGVHSQAIMKTRLLMIAGVGLLVAACNRQAPEPAAPKTDLDRFQGTWYLVMAMQDGKSLPEDKVKQTTIVIRGDTFRFPRVGGIRHQQVGDDQARRNEEAQ